MMRLVRDLFSGFMISLVSFIYCIRNHYFLLWRHIPSRLGRTILFD